MRKKAFNKENISDINNTDSDINNETSNNQSIDEVFLVSKLKKQKCKRTKTNSSSNKTIKKGKTAIGTNTRRINHNAR